MSMFSGGAWFGWPAPLLPQLLGRDSPVPMNPDEASWMVSSIELGTIVAFLCSYVSDHYGRKFSILLCVPVLFISVFLTVFVRTITALFIARSLQGAAICFPYTVLPLYLGEIASVEARGRVTSFFHIFWGLGCLFPYCVGPFLSYDNLTYATFGTTLLFALCFIWQPESPYYYAINGNETEMRKTLLRLRDSPSEEALRKELEEIQLEVKKALEIKASWRDVIATPADRKALLLLVIVGIISFLSGQNAILTYTTDTFYRIGNDFLSPDLIMLGVGIVAFVGSIFSIVFSDRYGRRFLLFVSSIGCMISLFVASGYFYLQLDMKYDVTSFSWVAPIAIMSYNLFVTAGMHPVCVTYTSELFSTKTRGVASSINNISLAFCSFLVMKVYEPVTSIMGLYFIYLCFAMVCLIGTFLFYFMMPETKGKTFLQIRQILEK